MGWGERGSVSPLRLILIHLDPFLRGDMKAFIISTYKYIVCCGYIPHSSRADGDSGMYLLYILYANNKEFKSLS